MKSPRISFAIAAALMMILTQAASVEAQGRGRGRGFRIPPGHMPAAGMCRVWYPGVPPGHQPPAVPCRALRGYRFVGAVVVEGPRRGRDFGYWDEVWGGPRFRVDVVYRSPDELRRDGVRIAAQWGRDARLFAEWGSEPVVRQGERDHERHHH
jgi:hypothetical protein